MIHLLPGSPIAVHTVAICTCISPPHQEESNSCWHPSFAFSSCWRCLPFFPQGPYRKLICLLFHTLCPNKAAAMNTRSPESKPWTLLSIGVNFRAFSVSPRHQLHTAYKIEQDFSLSQWEAGTHMNWSQQRSANNWCSGKLGSPHTKPTHSQRAEIPKDRSLFMTDLNLWKSWWWDVPGEVGRQEGYRAPIQPCALVALYMDVFNFCLQIKHCCGTLDLITGSEPSTSCF